MDMDSLFRFKDVYGNIFNCIDGNITLHLRSEQRLRNIGKIIILDGKIIYKKSEVEKHIHKNTKSWSLPKEIFNNVDGIWFYTKKHHYKVLTKDVRDNVLYLNFCNAGYENKIYIPLDLWHKKERKLLTKKYGYGKTKQNS